MSNRRQNGRADRDQDQNSEAEITTPRRKRRRWPWIVLALLVLLFFLPTLIVQTPLKQKAIDWATADFKGNIVVDKISTGWFSPTAVSGVTVLDESGQPLVTVDKVITTKSLYGFATAGNDYGSIEIESPKIYLQLRPDGSNLEDAIAEYMQPTDEPATDLPHLLLKVNQGEVHIASTTDPRTTLIHNLNINSEIAGQTAAVIAEVDCAAETTGEPGGTLQLKLALDAGSKQVVIDNGTCQLQTQSVPVAAVVPVLQRVLGPCDAVGRIDGNADLQFSNSGNGIAANLDRLTVTQFAFVSPEYLQNDQITLERLAANGQIQFASNAIQAVNFETNADFGSVTSNGQIDLAQLATLAAPDEASPEEFTAHGEVELAKIARMLPETLGLHQDLTVESGKVTFDVSTRAESGVRRLIVDTQAANLTARRGGQLLNWHQPLRVTARVAQSNDGIMLENVRAESDFVTVVGNANSQVGNFTIEDGDLALLQKNLAQFVDLAGVELSGKFGGEFGWSFKADQQPAGTFNVNDRPVQIGGRFEILKPIIQMPDVPRWSPEKLVAVCNGAGKSLSDGTIQINSGGARVVVGAESFTARLAEPVTDLAANQNWKFKCDVKGRVEGWLSHIRNFVWFGDFEATGGIDSSFDATVNSQQVVLSNLQYQLGNLAFDGYGAQFVEPAMNGDGSLSYDLNSGLINLAVFNVASSSLSARANGVKMTVTDVINVTGNVEFAANMNSITNWFGISPDQDSINYFGTIKGRAELASDQNVISARVTSAVDELVAAYREASPNPNQAGVSNVSNQMKWSEMLREKKVDVNGVFSMAQDFDTLYFSDATISASAVDAVGSGSISDLGGIWQLAIQGKWNPDWNKIDALLDAYTYKTMKLAGSGQQAFEVNGPLFGEISPDLAAAWIPPGLKIQTKFVWDEGRVLDLPLGASEIQLDVNQSVAFVRSTEIPFVGGSLSLKPIIDMRGEEPWLLMESGTIVNNINLSSEVCRQLLKYVTPLGADAAEAQGKLTLSVDNLQAPLYDPTTLQTRGTFSLREGSLSAGPLAKQLFASVQQVKQLLKPGSQAREMQNVWIELGDQEIPFAVQDGRVHHQGIRLTIDDVIVTTEGSVGLDQSVNLTANIPLQDEWIGDNKWLAGLRGQSLQIPIGGTVTQPRLDTQAIQRLSQQLIQQAGRSAVNNVIQEKTGEVQNRIQEEVQGAQQKLNDKIQDGIRDSIGGELQKGLDGLFNRGGN